jgi:hypothetical protein
VIACRFLLQHPARLDAAWTSGMRISPGLTAAVSLRRRDALARKIEDGRMSRTPHHSVSHLLFELDRLRGEIDRVAALA